MVLATAAAIGAGLSLGLWHAPAYAQRPPQLPGLARVRAAAVEGRTVRVIVRLRDGFSSAGSLRRSDVATDGAPTQQRSRFLSGVSERLAARARPFRTIPFAAVDVDANDLAELEADPNVIGIEEDSLLRPALAESGPLVGAPSAWSAGLTGEGWTVALLDTGVDRSHPFLGGRIASEACYSNAAGTSTGTSLCPGGAGVSTSPGAGEMCDLVGCSHGTHVAGIAVGRGAAFSGIAPDARLISIQIYTRFDSSTTCGGGTPCVLAYTSDMILALERVLALTAQLNVAAVNLSIGGATYADQATCDADNASLKAVIDTLRLAGVATVIAAGNDGRSDALSEPGCISSAVSVGATTKADDISSFSNVAPSLSLLAPGSSMTSSVPGGGFGVRSGTSMAVPHVAGGWAVLKQRRATASVSSVLSTLQSTGAPRTRQGTTLIWPRIDVGAAARSLPVAALSLDIPASGSSLDQPFHVGGWAFDPAASAGTGVDAVHVYAYPAGGAAPIFTGAAELGGARPDLGALVGAAFASAGFNMTVQGLAPGSYVLVAYAHSSVSNQFEVARTAAISVRPPVSVPTGAIDRPFPGALVGRSFFVGGWALDLAARLGAPGSGTGVDAIHVYAYPSPGSGLAPVFLGSAGYGGLRPDVTTAFGLDAGFASSGFGLVASGLPPGPHQIVVYAHSVVSGLFSAMTRDVTVRAPGDPAMAIDAPVDGGRVTLPFAVGGWAIDLDAPAGAGVETVHVWGYPDSGGAPVFLGVAAYGGTRGDLAAAFGAQFARAGFDLTVTSLPAGGYNVVAYARSTVTGTFAIARAVRVTVE